MTPKYCQFCGKPSPSALANFCFSCGKPYSGAVNLTEASDLEDEAPINIDISNFSVEIEKDDDFAQAGTTFVIGQNGFPIQTKFKPKNIERRH